MKNTSTIFYGPTHINITICSDDSSSYSLIMTLVLYIMTEAGSDSLITKVSEAMAIWLFVLKFVIAKETLEGSTW